jgi:hypothetical protein
LLQRAGFSDKQSRTPNPRWNRKLDHTIRTGFAFDGPSVNYTAVIDIRPCSAPAEKAQTELHGNSQKHKSVSRVNGGLPLSDPLVRDDHLIAGQKHIGVLPLVLEASVLRQVPQRFPEKTIAMRDARHAVADLNLMSAS